MNDTAERWDGEAGHYQKTFKLGGSDYNARLMDFLARECGLRPGCRVIDIGCGVGRYGVYFARMGCDVTLTDISPAMLEYAGKNLAETGGKWRAIAGDWGDISLERLEFSQKFDLAVSTMSPAVHDDKTVGKMIAVTDGWCFISRFYKWRAPLTSALCRALELPEKAPMRNMEEDCGEMIRAVSAAGYPPLVTYQDYNWQDMRTPRECAQRFVSRYFEGAADEKMFEQALSATEKMADENGLVKDSVDTKTAWIYWNTRAR